MKLAITFLLVSGLAVQPSSDLWNIFAKVKFTQKFFKEPGEYYLVPFLDSRIRFYEGKDVTLEGHYLPFDLNNKNSIIISKYPYSACFFCGGAGPESVAEIVFASKPPRMKADQVITVTGILKLNDKDINHMNFILEQARLESEPQK
jgi:hypothetical protein